MALDTTLLDLVIAVSVHARSEAEVIAAVAGAIEQEFEAFLHARMIALPGMLERETGPGGRFGPG